MAIQEQLDILRQGAMEWNTWRKQNREVHINLSFADLSGADLSGADLSGADLSFAHLSGANFSRANLSGANFSRANLSNANLSNADLSDANLSDANLNGAHLSDANLSEADLSGAHLSRADLSGAHLSRAHLNEVHLSGADLSGADLSGADLSFADLSLANLSNADLSLANLSKADLSFADLSLANLSKADLSLANLSNADLSLANLSGAIARGTVFGSLDLRTVKGLETIQHRGPSEISTSTLSRSQGDIPDLFLRGAGLDDTLIDYVHSLTSKPNEYYTCFISYSSKDELFARRLHNDLRQKGVLCWFAPEDMNVGDKIRNRIEESIKLYDKLLLILSESSIASKWVAHEVERALNKEPQGIPNVLYPVRVDKAIMTCTETWVYDIKSTRHIGDFENWTDPQQYEKSFQRLLRALTTKKEQQKK